jgi:hypothetical protein
MNIASSAGWKIKTRRSVDFIPNAAQWLLLVPDAHEIENDQDGKRRAEQPEKNQKH